MQDGTGWADRQKERRPGDGSNEDLTEHISLVDPKGERFVPQLVVATATASPLPEDQVLGCLLVDFGRDLVHVLEGGVERYFRPVRLQRVVKGKPIR